MYYLACCLLDMCVILALSWRDVCMVVAWHSLLIFAYVLTSVKFFSMCLRVSSNFHLIALPVPLSVRFMLRAFLGCFFDAVFGVFFGVVFFGLEDVW